MSQLYQIYSNMNFLLARTVVIKFDFVSEIINKELSYQGYQISPYDITTHKYYMNLAGEYHDSDRQILLNETGLPYMTVAVATDNGPQTVPFTKELFHGNEPNISLLNEYQLGNDYYKQLVNRYPRFINLINGILNPIDKQIAIAAKDGTILSIGFRQIEMDDKGNISYHIPSYIEGANVRKLIEHNEYNLITELQSWVSKVLFRWFNYSYTLTDDMYAAYFLGMLYANITNKILNIRLANCFTPMVHSFHVREFLESHGKLGKYIDYIPYEQTMYLYRNVRYLELNLGKTFVFDELIDNLLTPTGIPLAGYMLRHDLSEIDGLNKLLPDAKMHREHINFKSIGGSVDVKTIRNVLDDEKLLARENYKYLDLIEQDMAKAMSLSGDDYLYTKVLESELFDIIDPAPVDLFSMLLWFWVYLASKGLYRGSIFVANPVSNERIALTPLNAFILMLYCANRAVLKIRLKTIPNDIVTARWITRSNDPDVIPKNYPGVMTLEEQKQFCDMTYISTNTIKKVMGDFDGDYEASSPSQFYSMVKKHHDELRRKFFNVCYEEDMYANGYAEKVMRNCYWHDIPVTLAKPNTNYDSWLKTLGIDFENFEELDYLTLAEDLVVACVSDTSEYKFTRAQTQEAMINIMRHFGSYTTHYIYSINEGSIVDSGGKHPRITNKWLDGLAGVVGGIDVGFDMQNSQSESSGEMAVGWTGMDLQEPTVEEIVINAGMLDVVPEMTFGDANIEVYLETFRMEVNSPDE